uniref:E3 ubiquitin-protein ligase n=1 Tax=Heligmosomoides polygyrus TaxID=6339 RepID=A0A8L8Q1A5_HELPZ
LGEIGGRYTSPLFHLFFTLMRNIVEIQGDKRVKDAVLYCKSKADLIKLAGHPLYAGPTEARMFDPQVRKEALHLNQFLDRLITLTSVRTEALFSKLRIMLAQGETYEAFKAAMNELDVSLKCNTIWENDSVAYRCNTCALTPCMSLCASCFQAANHEGHDFTRFFSREGGACDCGNSDVIRPIGFCPRHGENAIRPPPPSPLIVSLPRHIFLKLLVCLFLEWRGFRERYLQERESSGWEEPFNLAVQFFFSQLILKECVNYGGPMREAMAEILMDKELYSALTERNSDDAFSSDMSLDWRTKQKFYADRMGIFSQTLLHCFPEMDPEKLLECECLLDELLFWVIRMNFPQNLINFSLSMLSEPNYTDALSNRFFTWYPLVASCVRKLCIYQQQRDRSSDVVQTTCSRLIHISVQMLSSEALCKRLNDSCDLVNVVLTTACYLLTESQTMTEMTLGWLKIRTMTQHGYWFVMGDMQNLLAHPSLAINTVLHPTAFSNTYVTLLNKMQGMNMNWRIVRGEHRENDNTDLVQRSFTLEFEALALTMFNFVGAINQQQHYVAAVAFFDKINTALMVTFEVSKRLLLFSWMCRLQNWHLSTALTHFNGMELFRNHVEDFRKNEPLLRRLVLHPLKIQVARAEYYAGMWVRNGNQLRVQAIIYAQPHINTSFQTPDTDLIRWVTVQLLRYVLCSKTYNLIFSTFLSARHMATCIYVYVYVFAFPTPPTRLRSKFFLLKLRLGRLFGVLITIRFSGFGWRPAIPLTGVVQAESPILLGTS